MKSSVFLTYCVNTNFNILILLLILQIFSKRCEKMSIFFFEKFTSKNCANKHKKYVNPTSCFYSVFCNNC